MLHVGNLLCAWASAKANSYLLAFEVKALAHRMNGREKLSAAADFGCHRKTGEWLMGRSSAALYLDPAVSRELPVTRVG